MTHQPEEPGRFSPRSIDGRGFFLADPKDNSLPIDTQTHVPGVADLQLQPPEQQRLSLGPRH